MPGADIEVGNAGIDGVSMPTEAELMGVESESTEATSEPEHSEGADEISTDTAEAEGTGEPEGELESDEPDGGEDGAGESEDDTDADTSHDEPKHDKPPKGYIPKAAMHEARAENRYLKERMAELEAKLEQIGRPAEQQHDDKDDPWADFKELSQKEFDELSEEDPVEAIKYMNKLNARNAHLAERAEMEWVAEEQQREETIVAQTALDRMADAVPGLFDQEGVQDEFKAFAEDLGFREDMLFLTDPSVKVIMPGQDRPVMLGENAAALVEVLAGVKEKMAGMDRDSIKKEVEKEIRGDVEKELLAKFKESSPDGFKSLSEIQSSGGETDFGGKTLTATEYANLSEAEKEAYLAGA